MNRIIIATFILALVPALATADEIMLTNGHKIEGIVRQNKGGKVVVEVGSGQIVLDASSVSSIRRGRTLLHEYYERWDEVQGTAEAGDLHHLAMWARENGCHKFVVSLCEQTLAIESDHAGARGMLRHRKIDGKWLTHEEALAAQGLINVRGRWLSEAQLALREQKRLDALEKRIGREEERQRKRDEENARKDQRRRDYMEWHSRASRSEYGYWYRPSFFWPWHFRPYPWVVYDRAYRSSRYGDPYGGTPILNLQDFLSVPVPKFWK